MSTNKYLEYYLNSEEYSTEDVEKNIEETKKEFPDRDINVDVFLNQFGVYVITFEFRNKNTYFNKIKIWFRNKKKSKKPLLLEENKIIKETITESIKKDKEVKKTRNERKHEKIQKRFEKYYGENRYGKYKNTGVYKPY